jgi:hypothetical protein
VHIHKCAGTSVRAWLYRAVPLGFGSWYPNYTFDEQTLHSAGLADRRLRAFSSHQVRRFPSVSSGRRIWYFTLIRDPVNHVLSHLRYWCQVVLEGDPRTATAGIRDIIEVLLNTPGIDPFWDNIQTNFLARYVWCEGEGATFDCDPETPMSTWPARAQDAYLRARLRIAKEVLRSFLAVGTVERIVESLELLCLRAAPLGFDLRPPREITVENTTLAKPEDRAWIGEHDSVGKKFLEFTREDQELHAFAEHLLDEGRDQQASIMRARSLTASAASSPPR